MDKLDLNMKEVHKELVDFLKENFKKNGFSKAVLGLSGGIDSALAAYLLRDALGKENVLAAYETAVKERYRFFSFGDAMILIWEYIISYIKV